MSVDTKALLSNEIDRVRNALSSPGGKPLEYTAEALQAIFGQLEGCFPSTIRRTAARVISVWDRRGLPPPAVWLRIGGEEALKERGKESSVPGCGNCLQGALYYLGRTPHGVYRFVCSCDCAAGNELGLETWRAVACRGAGEVTRKDFFGVGGTAKLKRALQAMEKAEQEARDAPPLSEQLDIPF